jgi:hexosaminidase
MPLPGAAQHFVAIFVELRADVLPGRRPRAAAAAEVFWTGGALADGERSVGEALPRLHDWRYRALRRGVQAAPLQPYWCALRPGACDAD